MQPLSVFVVLICGLSALTTTEAQTVPLPAWAQLVVNVYETAISNLQAKYPSDPNVQAYVNSLRIALTNLRDFLQTGTTTTTTTVTPKPATQCPICVFPSSGLSSALEVPLLIPQFNNPGAAGTCPPGKGKKVQSSALGSKCCCLP